MTTYGFFNILETLRDNKYGATAIAVVLIGGLMVAGGALASTVNSFTQTL